jgi:hypothetical protein
MTMTFLYRTAGVDSMTGDLAAPAEEAAGTDTGGMEAGGMETGGKEAAGDGAAVGALGEHAARARSVSAATGRR